MLAVGIVIVMPELRMPALTKFIDGTGPVFAGGLFPFLFITIACGAVSGWHSLISSGTTPKLLDNETEARYIGYGGMLMEAFVAVMALIAACVLDPGIYFAMNAPTARLGTTPESAAAAIANLGFTITPELLVQTAKDVGEGSILSRTGGAPTLAVGMAHILHQIIAGEGMMAFWYHYAILFEALFILTTVDAGTRAGRFMIQDLAGIVVPSLKKTESWTGNVIATGLCVAGGPSSTRAWSIRSAASTRWAAVRHRQPDARGDCADVCVCLIKMKRDRYVWIPALPTVWLLACTDRRLAKIFHENRRSASSPRQPLFRRTRRGE